MTKKDEKEQEVDKGGRPTLYQVKFNKQAEMLYKMRAIDKEVCEFFGIAESTLNLWKEKHPKFMESIRKGRILADMKVGQSLFEKATGYTHKEVKCFLGPEGKVITHTVKKHYPPSDKAIEFWLMNRQRDKWSKKQTIELEGSLADIVKAGTAHNEDKQE